MLEVESNVVLIAKNNFTSLSPFAGAKGQIYNFILVLLEINGPKLLHRKSALCM